jgi:hypothetical protein
MARKSSTMASSSEAWSVADGLATGATTAGGDSRGGEATGRAGVGRGTALGGLAIRAVDGTGGGLVGRGAGSVDARRIVSLSMTREAIERADDGGGGGVALPRDSLSSNPSTPSTSSMGLDGVISSIVSRATRERILHRCSGDAFARYSTTSSSMMMGPRPP